MMIIIWHPELALEVVYCTLFANGMIKTKLSASFTSSELDVHCVTVAASSENDHCQDGDVTSDTQPSTQ